jgi:hypothetical protein
MIIVNIKYKWDESYKKQDDEVTKRLIVQIWINFNLEKYYFVYVLMNLNYLII